MTLRQWIDAMFDAHVQTAVAAGIARDTRLHALHCHAARCYLDLSRIWMSAQSEAQK